MQSEPPRAATQYRIADHTQCPATPDYQEARTKRQRMAIGSAQRDGQDQEPRFAPGPYAHTQPYNAWPATHQIPQIPPSQTRPLPGETFPTMGTTSDYHFGHQRTNSSATSSPYISPHTDFTGYSSTPSFYQPVHHSRDSSYHHSQYADMHQDKHVPQLAYPTPPKHDVQPPPRRAISVPWQSAAETLVGLSQATTALPVVRPSEGETTIERPNDAASEGRDHLTLPPLQFPAAHSTMPAPSHPGDAPRFGGGNLLPRIETSMPGEHERRSNAQPYQTVR